MLTRFTVVGGPNRPPPKNRPMPGAPPPILAATKRAKPTPQAPSQASYIQGASESARDIMTKTNEALAMRGEYLNSLGEKLNSVGADAAAFV